MILLLCLGCAETVAHEPDEPPPVEAPERGEDVMKDLGKDAAAWRDYLGTHSPEEVARAYEKAHKHQMLRTLEPAPTLEEIDGGLLFTMHAGSPPGFVPEVVRITVTDTVVIDRQVVKKAPVQADPLIDLQSEDRNVRKAAARQLGAEGDSGSVFALMNAAGRETHADTAYAMVDAIAAIGGPEGTAALKSLAETHADERVRNRAAANL